MIRTVGVWRESVQITSRKEQILAVQAGADECIFKRYVIAPFSEFLFFIKHALCLFR